MEHAQNMETFNHALERSDCLDLVFPLKQTETYL